MNNCFRDIKLWMSHNFLKLNDDKAELIVLRNSNSPFDIPLDFCLDDVNITLTESAKNLGFIFDSNLTLEKHININVIRT